MGSLFCQWREPKTGDISFKHIENFGASGPAHPPFSRAKHKIPSNAQLTCLHMLSKKKLTDMWKFALRSTCGLLSLKTQRSIYVDAGNSIFLGAGFAW